MIVDDLSGAVCALGTRWRLVSDRVMGGLSRGTLARETVAGREALRLRGRVRLENDGGFLQMALDLDPRGGVVDASRHAGIEVDVFGNGADYDLRLRTDATAHPWQSWRHGFTATEAWTRIRLPFAGFEPHRIDRPLDPGRLRRIGLLAVGRAFDADLAVGRVAFY